MPLPLHDLTRFLVFGSGFCALVYQIVWMRHLRLVFGASTAASAAVLAIFMGGLGLGSWLLGRRADRSTNPLKLYGDLELGIALSAAVSPALVELVRIIYVEVGGTQTLGDVGGTVVRLVLASLVLAVPTVLMGGTLPALARAVEAEDDAGRRRLGGLYASNTLGAVAGSFVATFFFLEIFGVRQSLWVATLVNLVVAITARSRARGLSVAPAAASDDRPARARGAPPRFVYLAAGGVGFAFFAMELVWYRMFAPLLGGSAYSFGLILTLALMGIGAGAWAYGLGARARRPTVALFAATCAIEAALMAIPFGLGDMVAGFALSLRGLEVFGFWGLVLAWTIVAGAVVVPPAFVAGYQFPVLVGLLGSGGEDVGKQVGAAYLANTLGAIAGSIAAGFGLMSLFGAPGLWVVIVGALLALAAAAVALGWGHRGRATWVSAAAGLFAVACVSAEGPTAAWRHAPIGAGRVKEDMKGPNDFERFRRIQQRRVVWEADGVESAVALAGAHGYSFLISGKSDGNAKTDAPTVVMSPLIGALLHPEPRRGLVIGLGTGSSAGWLAKVPTMESVDVVELEPAIEEVARVSAPVNADALSNPRVNVIHGDGREVLMTADTAYDVVMSEPSNPYRVGIASLFSRDFFQAASDRMSAEGIFVQWVQAYEIDARTVRTVVATMRSVFPAVEIWAVHNADLAIVGYKSPAPHDVERVRERVEQEPYRQALAVTWGVAGVEGFFSGFVAGDAVASRIAEVDADSIDTDDRPVLEFGFSRSVGSGSRVRVSDLRELAQALEDSVPTVTGRLDVDALHDARMVRDLVHGGGHARGLPALEGPLRARAAARQAYTRGQMQRALQRWDEQTAAPIHPADQRWLAVAMAQVRDPRAVQMAATVRKTSPVDAAIAMAMARQSTNDAAGAVKQLARAFEAARTDPWFDAELFIRALQVSTLLVEQNPELGAQVLEATAEPFAVHVAEDMRWHTRLTVAQKVDFEGRCVETLAPFEPAVPWEASFLAVRLACYEAVGHPLAGIAAEELGTFMSRSAAELEAGLVEGARPVPRLDVEEAARTDAEERAEKKRPPG